VPEFQKAHREWVEEALSGEIGARDERWSEAIAVGSREYVGKVKTELGNRAAHRQVAEVDGTYTLREPGNPYVHGFEGKNDLLAAE
jgi:putative transposase